MAVESGGHELPFPQHSFGLHGERGESTKHSHFLRLSFRAQGDLQHDGSKSDRVIWKLRESSMNHFRRPANEGRENPGRPQPAGPSLASLIITPPQLAHIPFPLGALITLKGC